MFCPNCGSPLEEKNRYCGNCGVRVLPPEGEIHFPGIGVLAHSPEPGGEAVHDSVPPEQVGSFQYPVGIKHILPPGFVFISPAL